MRWPTCVLDRRMRPRRQFRVRGVRRSRYRRRPGEAGRADSGHHRRARPGKDPCLPWRNRCCGGRCRRPWSPSAPVSRKSCAGSIGRLDADDSRRDLVYLLGPVCHSGRVGEDVSGGRTPHRPIRATGTTQLAPERVERTASAMTGTAARSPPRLLSSTATMAMDVCRCSDAMRLSVVTRVVKPARSATVRSSSSRSERQLWKVADSTTTLPSCCWSGWRRRDDTPTSRRTFTLGRQEGTAQSGLRAAAAQTAVAPARRTAATALGSI